MCIFKNLILLASVIAHFFNIQEIYREDLAICTDIFRVHMQFCFINCLVCGWENATISFVFNFMHPCGKKIYIMLSISSYSSDLWICVHRSVSSFLGCYHYSFILAYSCSINWWTKMSEDLDFF